MKRRVGLFLILATAAVLLFASRPLLAADTKFAQEQFKDLCSKCHGPNGFGDGPSGATLNPHPRNFHDCALMGKDSDAFIFREIKGGSASVGRSSGMPAWGEALEDDQIKSFIAYVRQFCK
jgi:mono/diheme cytochrome c family protein